MYVFYVSWRLWEADLYVFYVVLRPPRFEGPGCGTLNLTWIGAQRPPRFEGPGCGTLNWRGLGRNPRAADHKIYSWIIS